MQAQPGAVPAPVDNNNAKVSFFDHPATFSVMMIIDYGTLIAYMSNPGSGMTAKSCSGVCRRDGDDGDFDQGERSSVMIL